MEYHNNLLSKKEANLMFLKHRNLILKIFIWEMEIQFQLVSII